MSFQEKRDAEVQSAMLSRENREITDDEINEIRSSIPPVNLSEVNVPTSDDEDAQKDLALKRKINLQNGRMIARRNQMRGRRILNAIDGMRPQE